MNTIAELKPYERIMIKNLAANVRQVEPYTLQLSKKCRNGTSLSCKSGGKMRCNSYHYR